MSNITEPPFLLDSARVLMYAETGGRDSYTGRITVHLGDKSLGPVPRVAICEDLVEGRILIMRCDVSWNVLAASFSSSVDEAIASSEREYRGISSKWTRYRALTSSEAAEVGEKRRTLRKLAAKYPLDGRNPHAV